MDFQSGDLVTGGALGVRIDVGAGHGVDKAAYPIDAMLEAAGVPDGPVKYHKNDTGGVLVIATPTMAAQLQNDAAILLMIRAIEQKHDSPDLDGKYAIIRDVNGNVDAGVIESWKGSKHLNTSNPQYRIVTTERLLAPGVQLVIEDDKKKAEKTARERLMI